MFTISQERASDAPLIDALHEAAFGPGRFAKTAYRLREGAPMLPDLNVVAWQEGELIGSVRFSPLTIASDEGAVTSALLLGPLAVTPNRRRNGLGVALMTKGLELAYGRGWTLSILIGDLGYYQRAGFAPVERDRLWLPGPVDAERLLVRELVPGAFSGVYGRVLPARNAMPIARRDLAAFGAPGQQQAAE